MTEHLRVLSVVSASQEQPFEILLEKEPARTCARSALSEAYLQKTNDIALL